MINDIKRGKRPSRPTNPNKNQWLQDPIWDTITTCWSDKPEQRCGLSVLYHIFLTPIPQDALVECPPVGHKNLVRLAEELLYTFLILPLDPGDLATLRIAQEYISNVISRDGASSPSLSLAEAEALATSIIWSHLRPSSFRLWLRLYTHALLLGSQIFPNIELSDESLGYMAAGFTDIWKANYHGEPVCIKAIRTQDPARLGEIGNVCGLYILSETHSAHSIPDTSSRNQWTQVPSERTPHRRDFRHTVSTLRHDSVDAGWEHRPVYEDKPGC
jgi:hypothetical protein